MDCKSKKGSSSLFLFLKKLAGREMWLVSKGRWDLVSETS
jgi:hypothetical protein